MKKFILIELSIGLTIMILVPVLLIAELAIESKHREENAERAGYTGYLIHFTGYMNVDGEWFAGVEVEESRKKFYIKNGGLSTHNQYKVYVMENSAEENVTADGYTYTMYRDHYGIWDFPPPYYAAVITGILIDTIIVLPVTLVVLVIVVVIYKIRNRPGNKA